MLPFRCSWRQHAPAQCPCHLLGLGCSARWGVPAMILSGLCRGVNVDLCGGDVEAKGGWYGVLRAPTRTMPSYATAMSLLCRIPWARRPADV